MAKNGQKIGNFPLTPSEANRPNNFIAPLERS